MSLGLQVLTPAERIALEDLFSAYHWALDMGDVEGFADTFDEQPCVVLHSTRGVQRFDGHAGLVNLVETLRAWDAFPGCQHHSGQLLIEPCRPGCVRVRSFVQVVECRGEPALCAALCRTQRRRGAIRRRAGPFPVPRDPGVA